MDEASMSESDNATTGILSQFDVKHWYNGMIVVAVIILLAAMFRQNTPVTIIALGLLATGFGGRLNYSPETTITPRYRYTVMEWQSNLYGSAVMAIGVAVMLFGGYRLCIAA
jgi:hypothetical protein